MKLIVNPQTADESQRAPYLFTWGLLFALVHIGAWGAALGVELLDLPWWMLLLMIGVGFVGGWAWGRSMWRDFIEPHVEQRKKVGRAV